LAVTPIQKTKFIQPKRVFRRRIRHERGVLVQLSLAFIAIRIFGVDLAAIFGPARGVFRVTFARHVSMYVAVVEGRLSFTETAIHFGRDRRSVAYAVARIEAARDADWVFDLAMNSMMAAFRSRLDDLTSYYRLTGALFDQGDVA
jgi:hypothetical protein